MTSSRVWSTEYWLPLLGKPRISVVSFYLPWAKDRVKPSGPIKELLSDDNNPPYTGITSYEEFMNHYRVVAQTGGHALPHFQLQLVSLFLHVAWLPYDLANS
ncbi:1-aminocyclopropane-1-carboxylate oxidase homolog 11 [Prunus yedoensis var. nudiflora]|uniref:1-aminocyclopropane-1-carboxylate oxidase homolog 11 n=1 Tax=Prunus yedoensis var. nudiflora TaxID=2094558 RepID=A0A314ZGT4_PRUYE|nr:1-aminocyclopropane-1-carboxylate oxidase homolog 11 [Prunus yedoensis var. nudiflora]